MSRTYHHGDRRIRVKGVKRETPDLRRMARALIEFARMQAEAEAEAEHAGKHPPAAKVPRHPSPKTVQKRLEDGE